MTGGMRAWGAAACALIVVAAIGAWQLKRVQPAQSELYRAWLEKAPRDADRGAAALAFGDFGALDLDTLETSAFPWPVIATSLALRAAEGDPQRVDMRQVEAALKSFGFLFPKAIAGHPDLTPSSEAPLGMLIGSVERTVPPLRVTAMTLGCAACHAAPAYRADGTPDPDLAVLGRPNSGLDLESFSQAAYVAVKLALMDESVLWQAMRRLFPDLSLRERLTLGWIVLPAIRTRIAELTSASDRPLPFNNGAPGLTNGVAALKLQLGLIPHTGFVEGAGFVSIPDLADRNFRSSLLADGAYAPKGGERFKPIARAEALARDPKVLAGITSFFMVPTMGMSSDRAASAVPALTPVLAYLARTRPPKFPGPIDLSLAESGRLVYARDCARCHGTYDASLSPPQLLSFPNWAGDVGTDRARVEAFDVRLKAVVDKTVHARRFVDAAATGKTAAPLLSGVWSSAPYLTNGSVPTLRHLLDPASRPPKFMTGGHRIDVTSVGIAGAMSNDRVWTYPTDHRPNSKPVVIDTSKPGFSNRGHDREVQGLGEQELLQLLEYLKLL